MPQNVISILYVDDDADDYFLLQASLKKLVSKTYILERAESFEEALNKLHQPYDIFLLDYKLGKNNGLSLLKKIRDKRKFVPVILLTGMENAELDQRALYEGASDYLVKGSFTPNDLERAIRYAIRDSKALEAIEINARRFRSIFERSADPIVLIAKDACIISANPSFCRLFDYIHPVGGNSKVLFSSFISDKSSFEKMEKVQHSGGELTDFEVNMTTPHKSMNVLINVVPHDAAAGTYQVMIKDLTSIKQKEEEDQLMRKFSSTGRIARILAHEIKNPLTNITLSADQLKAELPEEVKNESGELIEVIERNTKRINALINQLLNSTRFADLVLANYSVNKLAEEALEQANDSLQMKQIKVITDFAENVQDISIDADKVRIALFNLIINAVDAMEAGKGFLTLTTYAAKKRTIIEVRDNGCGLNKEQMEKIFEPFFSGKSNGTGLGLTNAQNIMLSHQGTLKVNSTPGKGTSFYMVFNEEENADVKRNEQSFSMV